MKPFNIEAAKRGEPVCNRNENKVRIVCWDVQCDPDEDESYRQSILGLVMEGGVECVESYRIDGRFWISDVDNTEDLMMADQDADFGEEEDDEAISRKATLGVGNYSSFKIGDKVRVTGLCDRGVGYVISIDMRGPPLINVSWPHGEPEWMPERLLKSAPCEGLNSLTYIDYIPSSAREQKFCIRDQVCVQGGMIMTVEGVVAFNRHYTCIWNDETGNYREKVFCADDLTLYESFQEQKERAAAHEDTLIPLGRNNSDDFLDSNLMARHELHELKVQTWAGCVADINKQTIKTEGRQEESIVGYELNEYGMLKVTEALEGIIYYYAQPNELRKAIEQNIQKINQYLKASNDFMLAQFQLCSSIIDGSEHVGTIYIGSEDVRALVAGKVPAIHAVTVQVSGALPMQTSEEILKDFNDSLVKMFGDVNTEPFQETFSVTEKPSEELKEDYHNKWLAQWAKKTALLGPDKETRIGIQDEVDPQLQSKRVSEW